MSLVTILCVCFYHSCVAYADFSLSLQVVEALLKAAADGVKVISISLGGSVGWLGVTAAQITIDYLVSQGINIVVAAGNDGSEGLFFAEAPSTTVNGHSVGSV